MESFSFREIYYFLGSLNLTILLIGTVSKAIQWIIRKFTDKRKSEPSAPNSGSLED